MSQVNAPSPPDDAPGIIDLEAAISADPDSPAGIGEMLICLATCAEHYGHHRVMAASRHNSVMGKREERRLMKRSLRSASWWLYELLPRLHELKSDAIKDRIPEAGQFLCDAGKLAEKIYAEMRFDWIMLPQLRRIARESYTRPGDPGWDPLDNSLRKFRDDAGAVRSRLERLAATLRDSYANNLRQVATSRIETESNDGAEGSSEKADGDGERSIATEKQVIAKALGYRDLREFDKAHPDSLIEESNKRWYAKRSKFNDEEWRKITKAIDEWTDRPRKKLKK